MGFIVFVPGHYVLLFLLSLRVGCGIGLYCMYSRTSMARTLMARLPRLFRTHS